MSDFRATPRQQRGFQLVELVVATGIVAVLLATGLPRLAAAVHGLSVEHGAQRLASDLRHARTRAAALGRQVRVVVRVDRAFWTVEVDTGGGSMHDGAARLLPEGVGFDSERSTRIDDSTITIAFEPPGHTATNATIALVGSDGSGRRVIINQAGRVRVDE